MRVVVLGLSITSSWGNGHATTFRSLLRGLHERGHQVEFLERDVPWYRDNRDLPDPPYARIALYSSVEQLVAEHARSVRDADLVIVGSFVPEGVEVVEWVLKTARGVSAFYDIDTPVTLGKLRAGDEEYLAARSVPKFDLYLSFTGGPTLRRIEQEFGARMARALYCSVDPSLHYPERASKNGRSEFLLGYLGTYSDSRQAALEQLLIQPARSMPDERFAVYGPLYPPDIVWPDNVARQDHLPPQQHRKFYNSQRFTLNVTRADMVRAGYSPSVRLFEAAACGTPIISDVWEGIEEVFTPGEEILLASSAAEAIQHLRNTTDARRRALAARARRRVLEAHTYLHRAAELEFHAKESAGDLQPLTKKAKRA